MYEPTRIFRSLLLCGIIYTIANSIQIANALDTTYEIGGVTRTSEFIPNPAGANGSKAVYTPNSAAKMPNGTRIPYGLRGTLRTSSKLFKQLMLIEGGLEVIDWIKSQYALSENTELDTQTMTITQKIPVQGYICGEGCEYTADITGCRSINAITSLNCALAKINYSGNTNKKITSVNCQNNNCTADYIYIWQDGTESINGTVRSYPIGDESKISSWTDFAETSYPAGEPTIKPNPWQTGQIVEYYAAKIPQSGADGWEAYISPNVQILDQPIRWTELPAPAGMPTVDTVTDLIRVPGYKPKPPAIIPDPEPLRPDPDGLKKIPNPLLQGLPDPTTPNPPPAVRTQDLIGGGMTVTNTYNIQNTSTAINLNIENKEITYAGNEEEIKPPADLTETETLEARQRLLLPTTNENFMNSYVQDILNKVPVPQVELLSDNSATCPPPRRLALFGTTEIELSYEGICQFLPIIKAIMLGFIGFALFGVWIKRISSS